MDDRIVLAHVGEMRLGRLTVRASTRELLRDDGAREVVEPRVMQVLVALADATGATVTRDDLTRRCWDGRIVGEDAINRVLSRLRRIAEGIGTGSFRIETITKVGYRLVIPAAIEAEADVGAPSNDPPWAPGRRTVIAGAGALLGAAAIAWWQYPAGIAARSPDDEQLPADPEAASLYLRAREDWAQRQPDSIDRAIDGFGRVISRDPSYAPAYAGLADAYILAREFGSIDDARAFPRARAAADVALKLQPTSVAAQRARGFVQYWWEHRPGAAGRSLRRALALDPDDAQTHFWYGNALADNGAFPAALAELDRARELNPESAAIQTDWAWAQWSAGHRDLALDGLNGVLRSHPAFATAHDALAVIFLAERNFPDYLRHFSAFAAARGNGGLIRQAAEEQADYARGGAAALALSIMRHAAARGRMLGDDSWPAFVAASLGDRRALVTALEAPAAAGDRWGSAGQLNWVAARWRGDVQVQELLARCRAPAMT